MALLACGLLTASAFSVAPPAQAAVQSIDLPRGSLAQSIGRLADRTGVSIGYAGTLPAVTTHEVSQAVSAAEALRQMLQGTGYRAIQTGPASFRIERVAQDNRAAPADSEVPEEQITVTALKRPRTLSDLPATMRVIPGDSFRSAAGQAGTDDIGRELPSLTISSLGPGLSRLFLRGIGDGPLNGFNQGSVAVLLDEARLNYDAPDPDWALIDIDQVEVLEGPQGPLYGTGALGGIVKLSTNRPDLSDASAEASASLSVGDGTSVSNAQSAVLNLPLMTDRLGIRAVAYRDGQGGWIDNSEGGNNLNRERLAGGRLAIRWNPAPQWTVDLVGALQGRTTLDSQYVDGNTGPLDRPNRLDEPRDLDAKLAMLTVSGPIGSVELTSITSISGQEASADYDATPLAATLGTVGTTRVTDDRNYRLFDQELRIRNRNPDHFEWLAGLSFINASTDTNITAKDSATEVPVLMFSREVREAAAFAEASWRLASNLTLSGGGRIFSVGVDDEGEESDSYSELSRYRVRGAGDIGLSWAASDRALFFVHAATGYRPGGINAQPEASQPAYEADELASVELGSRFKLGSGLSGDATLYAVNWKHVQTDQLLGNGLVATRNAGTARNFGFEGNLRWVPSRGVSLSGAFMVQSARLEESNENSGIEDWRLPAVPKVAARAKIDHEFSWNRWTGNAGLGARYVGATHLSFDPLIDRRTPGHVLVDAHLSFERNGWAVGLVGENLTNSTADTFAFGNPYRVRLDPQRTPARPLSVGLQLSRRF
jgi:outer membrane receptor protein involved in Fe transport